MTDAIKIDWHQQRALEMARQFVGVDHDQYDVIECRDLGHGKWEFRLHYESSFRCQDFVWRFEIEHDADLRGDHYVDESRVVRLEVTRG